MKKKVLLTSVMTIALCLCLIVGSTYALFTSQSEVNVAVTAGDVNVVATINSGLKTWSLGQNKPTADTDGSFVNGGEARVENGKLVIERMTPGDSVEFTITVKNTSDIVTKYRLGAVSTAAENVAAGIKDLSEVLTVSASVVAVNNAANSNQSFTMSYDENNDRRSFESDWFTAPATDGENATTIMTIVVTVTFPNRAPELDNPYKKAQASIAFTVDAVQGNGVNDQGELDYPRNP